MTIITKNSAQNLIFIIFERTDKKQIGIHNKFIRRLMLWIIFAPVERLLNFELIYLKLAKFSHSHY